MTRKPADYALAASMMLSAPYLWESGEDPKPIQLGLMCCSGILWIYYLTKKYRLAILGHAYHKKAAWTFYISAALAAAAYSLGVFSKNLWLPSLFCSFLAYLSYVATKPFIARSPSARLEAVALWIWAIGLVIEQLGHWIKQPLHICAEAGLAAAWTLVFISMVLESYRQLRALRKKSRQLRNQYVKAIASSQDIAIEKAKSQQIESHFHALAHDLGNPLASLQGYIGKAIHLCMQEKSPLGTLHQAEATAESMASLMTIAKFQEAYRTGKRRIDPGGHSDIKECFLELEELFHHSLLSKGLTLKLRGAEEGFIVQVDHYILVYCILANLISNSIKFSREGGMIYLEVGNVTLNQIAIQVRDEGCGIAPQKLALLFDRSAATSTDGSLGEPGTGFGLVQFKYFMSEVSGTYQLTSKLGEGTQFLLTFKRHSNSRQVG